MPQYTLEQRIGVGGMAEVFRAQRHDTDSSPVLCAVKRLRSDHVGNENLKQRLLDEAAIAGRLHHPCIIGVFDSYELDGALHLVMEYVDGISLEHMIARGRGGQFIPLSVSTYIVHQLAGALAYAHGQGVLHRDVSSSNVLISASGAVKLTDFGLAAAAGRLSATAPGEIIGKWTYLSKRRQCGEPATANDDVYALGVILERLLGAADPRERRRTKASRVLTLQRRLTAEGDPHPLAASEIAEMLAREELATPAELAEFLRRPLARPHHPNAARPADLAGSTLEGPAATRVGRRK